MKYYYYFSTSDEDGLHKEFSFTHAKKFAQKEFGVMIEGWITEFLNKRYYPFIIFVDTFVLKKLKEMGFERENYKCQSSYDFCTIANKYLTKELSKAVKDQDEMKFSTCRK